MQRGKFFPQLTNLVRINTPKAVQTESRKAFRKVPLQQLEAAANTLTNLKGVGITLASGGAFHPRFAFLLALPLMIFFLGPVFLCSLLFL